MPEWLATLDRYDDPSIDDMREVWGYQHGELFGDRDSWSTNNSMTFHAQ